MMMSNERGSFLIEVMVASSVAMVGIMAISSFMQHQLQTVNYMEDKMSKTALEQEFKLKLLDTSYCEGLLGGVSLSKFETAKSIVNELDLSNSPFRKENGKLYYDKLRVTDISLKNEIEPPRLSGLLRLDLSLERLRKGGGPPALKSVSIPVSVTTEDALEVKTCSLKAETEEAQGCLLDDLTKPTGGNRIRGGENTMRYFASTTTALATCKPNNSNCQKYFIDHQGMRYRTNTCISGVERSQRSYRSHTGVMIPSGDNVSNIVVEIAGHVDDFPQRLIGVASCDNGRWINLFVRHESIGYSRGWSSIGSSDCR